ncbi:MAG: DMT family transporter [Turicibacter sp.]|nr:DMT family transporter [Turicibacter sp.]
MYYFIALATGVVISVMIAVNGGLTGVYGLYLATAIIHATGLILISTIAWIKKDRVFVKHPWFLYTGGFIGIVTIMSNNLAFGRISLSAILALGLLGQTITGIAVDQYGLLGMPKYSFNKSKLIGLILIIGGIAVMIDNVELLAMILSFVSGISIVLARTVNAKLADLTNARVSSVYNYITGLIGSVLILAILGRDELFSAQLFAMQGSWFIYFGGALGLCVVLLSNITVVKISAFYLTMLVFIGQIFAGLLIDVVLSGQLSIENLLGGVFVAFGLCISIYMDRR